MTSTTTEPAPIAAAATWTAVMGAARYQCQCQGGCGRSHAKETGGRCPRQHKSWCRLVAAPPQPTGNPHRDALAELVAYCPPCFDGHARAGRRAERNRPAEPAGTVSLFDLIGDES